MGKYCNFMNTKLYRDMYKTSLHRVKHGCVQHGGLQDRMVWEMGGEEEEGWHKGGLEVWSQFSFCSIPQYTVIFLFHHWY